MLFFTRPTSLSGRVMLGSLFVLLPPGSADSRSLARLTDYHLVRGLA